MTTLRHTLAELEALATIPPVKVAGGRKERMGCPFHGSDHQRSLEVDLKTGRFACYTCDVWGYLSDHPGKDKDGLGRPLDRKNYRPGASAGFRTSQEARTAPTRPTAVLQNPLVSTSGLPGQAQKLARYMAAAQQHLEDPESINYLNARYIPLDLARAYGLGYFPSGKWPGRKAAARWGRVAFPLETSAGELVGIYSRAVDPAYPQEKAPKEPRHDVWGKRGLFHSAALVGPSLFLTEGPFDALAMLGSGWPAAALVGTKGLAWSSLGSVRELYLCLDLDVTGEGQNAARKLAREAVMRGVSVHTMDDGAYGGHSEPSDQWEAEGRVTLDGTEMELCQECKAPVQYYASDGAPYCDIHGHGLA